MPPGIPLPQGRKKPWGTGHAVLACRKVIHEPFCVLNADDYYGAEAFRQIHAYISADARSDSALDCCMAGYVLGNTLSESGAVTRGVCRVNDTGELVEIRETHGVLLRDGRPCVEAEDGLRWLDGGAAVSMNIWGLPPAFIGYLEEQFPRFLERLATYDVTSEFLLPTIIGRMIRSGAGSVRVLPTGDRWFGMTYAQDKADTQRRIAELIARGDYPPRL